MTNPDVGGDYTQAEDQEKEDWTVREGMDVLSYDGEKLGEVANATGNYILVRHGFLFAKEYYVPADAIANVGRDAVYLTVTKEIALEQHWDKPPIAETDHQSKTGVVTGSAAEVAAETTEPQTGIFSAPRAMAGETAMDDETGTFADPRSGPQSVLTADAERALSDAEITADAQETVSAAAGIPVTGEAERIGQLPKVAKPIDQLPGVEPQNADDPLPGDANPEDALPETPGHALNDSDEPHEADGERIDTV